MLAPRSVKVLKNSTLNAPRLKGVIAVPRNLCSIQISCKCHRCKGSRRPKLDCILHRTISPVFLGEEWRQQYKTGGNAGWSQVLNLLVDSRQNQAVRCFIGYEYIPQTPSTKKKSIFQSLPRKPRCCLLQRSTVLSQSAQVLHQQCLISSPLASDAFTKAVGATALL